MSSRSVLLSVLVLFVSSAFVAMAEPARKPAAKVEPSAAKPVLPSGPVQGVPPEAITRALEQPIIVEFIETPLSDVVGYLIDLYKIPILIDKKAIDDVGVQPDTPITITLKGVKLRSALNHMLRQHELTWTVQDEVLVITTPEQADATLQTRIYEVADLVAARDEQLRPYNDFDQLIDAITSTVKPAGWDTVGGPGSIAAFEATGITVLVVSQTLAVHEDLEKLLADLRKAKHPGGDVSPPLRKREPKLPMAEGFPGNPQPPQPQPKPPAKN